MEEERRSGRDPGGLEIFFDHRRGDVLLGVGVQHAPAVPGDVEHPLPVRRRDSDLSRDRRYGGVPWVSGAAHIWFDWKAWNF
jgi:hypothetical protein